VDDAPPACGLAVPREVIAGAVRGYRRSFATFENLLA
jgi:hypothetical protein